MLYTGYFCELKRLQQKTPSADFGFMANEYEGTTTNAYAFLRGMCYVFAYALSMRYGYEIEMITDWENSLIHAYCIGKRGDETIYMDIRGITTDEYAFFSEFEDAGVRLENNKLDSRQFEEGYLRATKYLSAESFMAQNPTLFRNCNKDLDEAERFIAALPDHYELKDWMISIRSDAPLIGRTMYGGRHKLQSIQEVADFIMEHGKKSDLIICKDKREFISTFGIFINKCTDPDYLQALKEILIPMQQAYEQEVLLA